MSYRYVDNIADIVLERVNIIDVISSSLDLKKTGSNYKGLCPFHSEKTPSFVVNEDRQFYHCFGCGKGGNSITFMMEYHNLDFINAIEMLAEMMGIDLTPYIKSSSSKNIIDTEPYYEINKWAAKIMFYEFDKSEKAVQYFKNRGISDKTRKRFGVGYARDSWDFLVGKVKNKNLIEKSGLFVKGKKGYYDRFRDRIIFPIFDLRKRVIAFGARTIDPEENVKYINSPETPVYTKGSHLYALHEAKNSKENYIILVEGYMDVLSLFDEGITNVVAALGTALTIQQAKQIKKYTKKVVIIFDNDDAGIKATKRSIPILSGVGLSVGVVNLVEGLDPDEYVRKYSKDEFLNYISSNEKDGYEYLIDMISKDKNLDNMVDRKVFLEESMDIIRGIQDKTLRKLYLDKLSKMLKIDLDDSSVETSSSSKNNEKYNYKKEVELKLFISLLLSSNEFVEACLNSRYSKYLSENYKMLISYLIKNNGYSYESAIETFELNQVVYLDKCYKYKPTESDLKNSKYIFEDAVLDSIDTQIDFMTNNLSDDYSLNKLKSLQKVKIELLKTRWSNV